MYSKDEKSRLKSAFWTAYGQYMKAIPILDEEGKKKNWINYKTGIKGIYFKTDVSESKAFIAIEINLADEELRSRIYQQFQSIKNLLTEQLQEEWIWEKEYIDQYDKIHARIYIDLPNVNIFKKEYWPEIISFFKPRILALDAFWENVKPSFEEFS